MKKAGIYSRYGGVFALFLGLAALSGGCGAKKEGELWPYSGGGMAKVEKFDWLHPSGIKFIRVAPGEFRMGTPDPEDDRAIKPPDEVAHRVKLTRAFSLAATEVTQGQWEAVMGSQPWEGKKFARLGKDYPAVYITWQQAVDFCARLTEQSETHRFRLPTEAEWEYACRAGTTDEYSFSTAALERIRDADKKREYLMERVAYGGYKLGPNQKAAPLLPATTVPNPWGFYDLHGSVWEWCSDWYGPYSPEMSLDPGGAAQGGKRVIRGGSWYNKRIQSRSANRQALRPDSALDTLGLRVAAERKAER